MPASFSFRRDLVYACIGQLPLTLDLYLPRRSDWSQPPLVVWIHGGGWREGSKARPPVRRLTDFGFAVASISHRFSQQEIFPAQIHDCKAAVRWLRAHADQLGYSCQKIAVVGASSGGHLALLLATTGKRRLFEGQVGEFPGESSEVACVATYFPPTDFVLRAKTQPDIIYTEKVGSFALLGGVRFGSVDPKLEFDASPINYVDELSPPWLGFHGTADELVLPDQSQAMLQRYQQFNRAAELVLLKELGHGGADFFWGENFDRLVAFLKRHVA